MFYDNYVRLCALKGVSPSKAAIDSGLSKSTVSRWKKSPDIAPSGAVLEALASYFQVPVSELLGEEKEKPLINKDEELAEYLDMLRRRPECRMLFQLSRDATKEDVETAVRIIEALRRKD